MSHDNNSNKRIKQKKNYGRGNDNKKFPSDYLRLPSSNSSSLPSRSSAAVNIPPHAWKTLVVLSCIAAMVMYAETMLIPAIPDLIKDFHVSYGMSSWILTSYLISGAVMTPIAGKLSDIYGKKKMLLSIMIIYGLGVSAAGFSNSIIFMLVSRAIQGIGLSMFPIAFSIVREQFPRQKIAIGQGIISSMFAAGSSIGLYIGGTIIQHFGWHATFFTITPISIILLFTIWRVINIKKENSESIKSIAQIDVKGAATLATSIISFLLILTYSQIDNSINDINSPVNINSKNIHSANANAISLEQVLILLALGITSLIAFIIIEKRAKYPLIDFKLLLNKAILPANLMIMIFGICMFTIFQTIPILTRIPGPIGFEGNAIAAGNVQLPFALILLIFGSTSGFLISKFGSIKPIIAGSIIMVVGFFVLSLLHSSEIAVSVNLAVVSAGMALINVGGMNVVTLVTPRQSIGISLGMNMLIRIIGSSIGPAIAGMYMQRYQSTINIHGLIQHLPSANSFDLIFTTSTVLSVVSLMLALILSHRVTKMRIPYLR